MQQKKRRCFFSVFPLVAVLILMPQTVSAQTTTLVPVGKTVGVTLDTEGLLVLGTGTVYGEENGAAEPCKGTLKAGDRILEVNGQGLENKEAFLDAVESSKGEELTLLLERNGRKKEVKITPVFSETDNAYKIGAWVRDSIQGIGTVTYYDPAEGAFGALGHGVYDVDTGELMIIRQGALASAELTEIVKGQKGTAGELVGKVNLQEKIAKVEKNTETGIFGTAEGAVFKGNALPVAEIAEIEKGRAVILSDLEGDGVKEYTIQIESIDRDGAKNNKDMAIRITDERLLKLTGGIVQGMSGSPILQDGKIIGAVTYVMLNDPARGYGTFIENML